MLGKDNIPRLAIIYSDEYGQRQLYKVDNEVVVEKREELLKIIDKENLSNADITNLCHTCDERLGMCSCGAKENE